MLSQMSIRNKLALVLWGAALLAFAAVGGSLLLYRQLTLETRVRQYMEPYALLVSVGAESAVAFEDPVRAQEILNGLRANPYILRAEMVLEDGRPLAAFGSRARATWQGGGETADHVMLRGNHAEMVQRLPGGGTLRLAMSLDQLHEQTRRTLWLFAAGVLFLGTATIGQLMILRRTISRPVAALAEATERVRAGGDYSLRVPDAGRDEIGRLGQSFNAMLDAVRERERHLNQLTAFQRTILDNAAYGIVSTTSDGVITSFNRAAERLLGYTAEETVGKVTAAIWHDPQEVERRARALTRELGETISPGFDVFKARPRRNLPEEGEWTFIRKDGTRVLVYLSVTGLRDDDGRITGFVGLVYDLTERQRAEEQIRMLNRELEQRVADRTAELEFANQELESFSYSVSHDLRAPLRAIDGFSAMLARKSGESLDEEGRRLIGVIRASTVRMAHLIDDLLQFSRMSRCEMKRTPVDMTSLTREVFEEVCGATPERHITLRLAPLPPASGDRAMIRQVLVNLLSNAVKFTAPRREAVVEVEAFADGPQNVYRVRDNGVGFDMAYADKLFGVFQRLHGIDEFEGTGIGLAIVKRVVTRHGGKVWADSAPDAGATLHFTLPGAELRQARSPEVS